MHYAKGMTIPHSISNLDLKMPSKPLTARSKVPSKPVVARLKCPFTGNFTIPFWGAGGNTSNSQIIILYTWCHTIYKQ